MQMGAAMLGFYSADIDLAIIAIEPYRIVDTPLLVALPRHQRLFAQRTNIHTTGNRCKVVWLVAQRIGHRRVHCVLNFTGFTGASGVTIVALGALDCRLSASGFLG